MSDLRKKSEAELVELVTQARETLRVERFKVKQSRKSSIITTAKKEIARALTLLGAMSRNQQTK